MLFPQTIDNTYRGHKLALVLFGVVLLLRTIMGINMMFNGGTVASGADGIPLETYPSAAAGGWCSSATGAWCPSCSRCSSRNISLEG